MQIKKAGLTPAFVLLRIKFYCLTNFNTFAEVASEILIK